MSKIKLLFFLSQNGFFKLKVLGNPNAAGWAAYDAAQVPWTGDTLPKSLRQRTLSQFHSAWRLDRLTPDLDPHFTNPGSIRPWSGGSDRRWSELVCAVWCTTVVHNGTHIWVVSTDDSWYNVQFLSVFYASVLTRASLFVLRFVFSLVCASFVVSTHCSRLPGKTPLQNH